MTPVVPRRVVRHPALVAVAGLAGIAAVAGCGPSGSTPGAPAPTSSPASAAPSSTATMSATTSARTSATTSPSRTGATVTDPEATLAAQAAAMRTVVDGLIADIPATDWAPSADGDSACAVGTGERWPRQWAYAQRAFTVKDPKAHADRIVAALAAQGWSVTPEPAPAGQETRQLQRDAVLVIVSSATGPDVLDVHAVSPCVQADGTLDLRPTI